jgi:acyl transferase domain-containing protein/NAD(P)-dependent dehydrogenase (short-subunit alcohol dehydrogenase family)/SAM-dependent methyltransferase/acyl carrier protein
MQSSPETLNGRTSSRRLLQALEEAAARIEELEQCRTEPIAIVGMGCRFPGHVYDADSYWHLLCNGEDAITEVPRNRWRNDEYYDPDPETCGKIATRFGGFLDDIEYFDNAFFGISPREAMSLDPQQRLLLEVGWEALEDARQVREKLTGSSTGVFIGITTTDYLQTLRRNASPADVDGYFNTGNALNAAAGRLSYVLGLHGPSLAVDTACSSSLVAIHLACQSLRLRECDLALAGGVNLILSPDVSVAISRGRMLSPDGRCKTFDADADGYGRGEGCGLVVLKRYSDASADGDPIVAVIRGSAVNQDGASGGFTVPNGSAQQALIRKALANARLAPAQIQYVEAHGTGTALGDPIEVNALGAVLKEGRSPARPFLLGSVKGNIGHLESAAGVAGLIKAALAVSYGRIPPHRRVGRPNPHIAWDTIPVRIPTELTPWINDGEPRRAGVSSFGASGTNAHLVLEEAQPPGSARIAENERPLHLLAISAKTPEALRQLAASYCALITRKPDIKVPDLYFSANAGRSHLTHRVAILAGTAAEAAAEVGAYVSGVASKNRAEGRVKATEIHLGFFFPGNFHSLHLGRELYDSQPTFRRTMDRCMEVAGLSALPLGPIAGSSVHADLVSYAVFVSLTDLLRSWGIRPSVVGGQGAGEYAAAYAAGIFSLEDGMKLLADRAVNGGNAADRITYALPEIAFMSALTHRLGAEDIAQPPYWRDPLRNVSDAVSVIRALSEQNCNLVVTFGEAPIQLPSELQNLISVNLQPFKSENESDEWRRTLLAVAELYVHGLAVDWRRFDKDYVRNWVSLPKYPWQRQRCWIQPAKENSTAAVSGQVADTATLALLRDGDTESLVKKFAASGRFSNSEQQLLPKLLEALVRQHQDELRDGSEPFRKWLYEIEWRLVPVYGVLLQPGMLAAPEKLVAGLRPEADELTALEDLKAFYDVVRELEGLSADYAWQALLDMGWSPMVGERVTTVELLAHTGVGDRYARLLARLLEMLEEAGVLQRCQQQWQVVRRPKTRDMAAELARLRARCPEADAELTLLGRCGPALAAVMKGQCDPLELLFPEGDLSTAASLYQDSPGARVMNSLVEKAVARLLRNWPAGRGLRVLEIGAGTGGTTAYVLQALPSESTEYTFTDISPRFVTDAAEKFRGWGTVRGEVLDIERSPQAQGFAGRQYELIIASNVLHATQDLRQSLRHVRELLAPGGALVLLEGTGKVRFIDLIFGLTEGWWRFADRDLRPQHPLLSAGQWTALLEQSGFAGAAALSSEPETEGVLSRQAVIVAQAEHRAAGQEQKPPGRWLVLADEQGVGRELARLLELHGEACTLAFAGASYARSAEAEYRIDPASAQDFERLLAVAGEGLSGVVHLWSLDTEHADKLTAESLRAASKKNCGSTLHLVQALVRRAGATPPRICLVTRGAMRPRPSPGVDGFAQAPLWGLGHIISLEHPELRPRRLDVKDESVVGTAQKIFDEVTSSDTEDQVCCHGSGRYAARLVRHAVDGSELRRQPIEIHRDATYLVTGGLGGLGMLVADWLISRGAANLVLVGRSGPTPEAQAQLKVMADKGANVAVIQGDISIADDITRILKQVAETLPPLRGIIHAAGVLDDAMVPEQDWFRFSRVMEPKVAGTWQLFSATRERHLDFLVLFSSGASLLGSPGQANHAAANAFLDSFAHHLDANGVRAMSINWGAWAEVGAAAVRHVAQRLRAGGLDTIPPAQGLEALEYLFANGCAQVGVIPIDWPQFMRGKGSFPLLADFRHAVASLGPRTGFLDELKAAPARKRRSLAAARVEKQIANVLGMAPPARVDPQQGFFELGMDSLTSMEFRNRLQQNLSIDLPNTLTFDYPTPDAVTDYVLAQAGFTVSGESLTTAPIVEPGQDEVPPHLDELSRDRLASMIDAMILDVESEV